LRCTGGVWIAMAPVTGGLRPPQDVSKDSTATSLPSPQQRGPLWVYGVNAHLANVELPTGFQPTGNLRADYITVCSAIGAVPHPAFKPKPVPVKRREGASRKPSKATHFADSEPEGPKEETCFSVRSVLLDNPSMRLFSLLLPSAHTLKVLIFSDCSMDMEMLSLLRTGLGNSHSVEALQVEWNPFELPLPTLEEVEALSQKSAEADSEDPYSPFSQITTAGHWTRGHGGGGGHEADFLELRERRRYLLQSQRSLNSFRDWISSAHGGDLELGLKALDVDGDVTTALTSVEFHERVEARLGLSGSHVLEVFDILDGPDFAGGESKLSLQTLKEAMEQLQPWAIPEGQEDAIGSTLASFMDGECLLESVSIRSCAVGWPELTSVSHTLSACPWQLRSLNFWENRICDRGAELLGAAFEEYRGLEYLGLGRNRITDKGLEAVTKPFNHAVINESGLKAAQERVKHQQDHLNQLTKAAAKAKAKPDPNKKPPTRREPVYFVSTLEEVPPEAEGAQHTWHLKRKCELKSLNVSENPIRAASVVEALQCRGPSGAELLLRGTPAAEDMIKTGLSKANPRSSQAGAPGWILRLQ